jgi:hypothetical protein
MCVRNRRHRRCERAWEGGRYNIKLLRVIDHSRVDSSGAALPQNRQDAEGKQNTAGAIFHLRIPPIDSEVLVESSSR